MKTQRHSVGSSNASLVLQSKELLFALFILAVVLIFRPGRAEAATLTVATGSSQVNSGDSICQLEEAIHNIDDGARTYTDCVETGGYGTDDTIVLPAGTITGPGSSLPDIEVSAKVIGQGRGVSILDQAGIVFSGSGVASYTLQGFTMKGESIWVYGNSPDVTIGNVEIDLQGAVGTAVYVDSGNVVVEDSYLHNSGPGTGSGIFPLILYSTSPSGGELDVERTTLSDASDGILLQGGSGQLDALIRNTTITNMASDSFLFGIAVQGGSPGNVNYTTVNDTFSNISNSGSGFPGAAIFESNGAGNITHTAQNDLYAVGDGSNNAVNYFYVGGSSPGVATTISNGGNVSSDNSFRSLLSAPTDHNNVTNLASFLGVLADNGGSVPTLALLDGSPAIDAGTAVSGLTTDARGVARPQGSAFDAGAYELASSPGGNSNGNNTTPNTSKNGVLAATGQSTSLPLGIAVVLITLATAMWTKLRRLKKQPD